MQSPVGLPTDNTVMGETMLKINDEWRRELMAENTDFSNIQKKKKVI